MKAGVSGRASVQRLYTSDPDAALRVAEQIEHPWYRCQALCMVGDAYPAEGPARAALKSGLGSRSGAPGAKSTCYRFELASTSTDQV